MSNSDVHIVTGMDAIINPDNIKPGIDLKELEKRMISGGLIQQKVRDPQDRFNDELKDAASKLGISFGDFSKKTEDPPAYTRTPAFTPAAPAAPAAQSWTTSESDAPIKNDFSQNPFRAATSSSSEEDDRNSSPPKYRFGGDLHSKTREQERRTHIESVMGGSDISNFSFEKEKQEDVKCAMLAEIDSLMSTLAEEEHDITRVPKVDRESPFAEVESVLKMLRHKNDHTRYCSFAEEFLLFGAYALEDIFDGKRTWFNRYQPDLTGWHNHVNVKLKRMRHDTGQLVSGIMQDYNIGPGARVLLELIPNLILYGRIKRQQHDQPGLFSDDEMTAARNSIRELT